MTKGKCKFNGCDGNGTVHWGFGKYKCPECKKRKKESDKKLDFILRNQRLFQ